MTETAKKKRGMPSSFTILLILLAVVALITVAVAGITPEVTAARLDDFFMAPVRGFADALPVCLDVYKRQAADSGSGTAVEGADAAAAEVVRAGAPASSAAMAALRYAMVSRVSCALKSGSPSRRGTGRHMPSLSSSRALTLSESWIRCLLYTSRCV